MNWAVPLTEAPKVVESARRLYGKLSRTEQPQSEAPPEVESDGLPAVLDEMAELRTRLNDLESDLTRQAELASRMAAQEEALSQGLQAVSGRATAALWLSGGAALLAAVAIVVALLR